MTPLQHLASILRQRQRWLLIALLGVLHLALLAEADRAFGTLCWLVDVGLFILWQPFIYAERTVDLSGSGGDCPAPRLRHRLVRLVAADRLGGDAGRAGRRASDVHRSSADADLLPDRLCLPAGGAALLAGATVVRMQLWSARLWIASLPGECPCSCWS
jgi:hypothetical protein